jgi:tetratricopeptide (TPR) repeat protein
MLLLFNDMLLDFEYIAQSNDRPVYSNRPINYHLSMRKLLLILCLPVFIGIRNNAAAQTLNQLQNLPDSVLRIQIAQNTIKYCTEILNHKDQLKDKSKRPGFYANRAVSETVLKQYNKAINDYSAAISLKPDYVDAHIGRALLYEHLNQYQAAVNDFRKILPFALANDGLIVLYNYIAEAEKHLQHYDKAVEAYTAAITLNPQAAELYVTRAYAYSLMGKYQLGIDDINAVMFGLPKEGVTIPDPQLILEHMAEMSEKDRKSLSRYMAIRADIKRSSRNYKDAVNDYSLSLKLKPDNKLAYWNRASCYYNNGDYQLATDDYSNAITYYKGDNYNLSRLYDDRAKMEMGLQQYARAIADDSLAVSLDPHNAVAFWNKADAHAANADFEQSIAGYKKTMEFYQRDKRQLAQLYVSVADNEYFLKQYQQVVADCTTAITIDALAWGPYMYRGRAYLKLNKNEAAMADFKKVLAMDTSKKSIDYAFGLFYTGEGAKAIAAMQKNIIATTNPYFLLGSYYNTACIYALMNKAAEANTYLKKCIDGGYPKRYALNDPDLDNIRNTEGFKNMMSH